MASTAQVLDVSGSLPSGRLSVRRVRDANQETPANAVIQSVQFHSSGQLILTGGYDKTLRMFQVDGKKNAMVSSVFFPDLPIQSAAFCGNDKIVLAGPRPFYYTYDLNAERAEKIPRLLGGRKEKKLDKMVVSPDNTWLAFLCRDGYISIVSARSNQWVANLKINGQVYSASFTPDSLHLMCCGSDGEVYKFDMRTRRCILRHVDEGSLGSTVITSHANGMYATGSKSGVVNFYDGTNTTNANKPTKSLMHLTTPIDTLKFNPDGQIMAMSSKILQDSLKLVHLPSHTVFANWPTAKTPLHYVSCMDFSPSSGYFAVGNDRGRVLLYRLNHYSSI